MSLTHKDSAIRSLGDAPKTFTKAPVGKIVEDLGDRVAAEGARTTLDAATDDALRAVMVRLLEPASASRLELIAALSIALGGSIASLGYPVGKGQAPNASHLRSAAAKIIDRTVLCIIAEAADA